MPILTTTSNVVLEDEKERQGIQIGKEEAKLSPFANDMLLCI